VLLPVNDESLVCQCHVKVAEWKTNVASPPEGVVFIRDEVRV